MASLKEQIDWFANFNGAQFNNAWLLNGGENEIYSGQGAGGGSYYYTLYYWLNNAQVNKWQRYLGRVLFLDNSIAQTAIKKLTIMALGSGTRIVCSDDSKQKAIDEWVKVNKWKRREIEAFTRRSIDGEVFLRVFNNYDVRFVDPDLVYNNATEGTPTMYQGVISSDTDAEEILEYEVHLKNFKDSTTDLTGIRVPVEEMQHRKINSHFGARRGFSLLLPIASDLFNVDKLVNNLMATSNVLSKIAFWRKHKANEGTIQEFKAKIQTQGRIGIDQRPPLDNIENYPPASIVDLADETDIVFPDAQSLGEYNIILESTLRKVAAQFNLPSGVFNITHDDGAYNAQMVTNSFVVKSIEAMQEEWKEFNLELLEMCGFDTDDIQIICPEVAIVDKKVEAEVGQFLLQNKIASRETIATAFGIDYEQEQELMALEPEVEIPEQNPNGNQNSSKESK